MIRRLYQLARNTRGATAIEFAIIAPVMILLLMGIGDLSYQIYAQSILSGSLQKAGRDSTIQGAPNNTAAIDQKVTDMVKTIAGNATIAFSRKNYDSFSLIKPEPFTDSNGNGVRDPKECFTDVNGNGSWDADPGIQGQGGANDITVYTVTVTYPRIFPVAKLFGWSANQTISASTLLKNQPYASQSVITPKQVCT
jgi:Flp pilus assembly protein TadG